MTSHASIDNNTPTAPPLALRVLLELQSGVATVAVVAELPSRPRNSDQFEIGGVKVFNPWVISRPRRATSTQRRHLVSSTPPKHSPHSVSVDVKISQEFREIFHLGAFVCPIGRLGHGGESLSE